MGSDVCCMPFDSCCSRQFYQSDSCQKNILTRSAMEGPQKRLKLEVKAETEVTSSQQSMEAGSSQDPPDVSTHRRSRWRQGGRRPAYGGPTPVKDREHLADAWSILEFANSDQEFHVMATCMEGLCGLKIDDLGLKKPRRAVDNFFERYTGKAAGDHRDHFFRHEQQDSLWIAVLVTPSFYDKKFRGEAESTAVEAELSACRCFAQDPDVLEACSKLPPALNKIRDLVYLSEDQKKALRKQGYDPKLVQSQMVEKLHLKFRDFGLRTAVWDGNFWWPKVVGVGVGRRAEHWPRTARRQGDEETGTCDSMQGAWPGTSTSG